MPVGSKFKPAADFGYVRLEINDVLPKDEGVFKVIATNEKGSSSSSGTLKLFHQDPGVKLDSLHPSGSSGMAAIGALDARIQLPADEPEKNSFTAPYFTTDLPEQFHCDNNHVIQLYCNVEPKNDPSLKIDWHHNGVPLITGSRVQPNLDFGFVSLRIGDASIRDEGIYTCKATNSIGEAVTFSKVFNSPPSAQSGVDSLTMHPHGEEGYQSLGKLKTSMILNINEEEEIINRRPPKFTTLFGDQLLEQGSIGHFEAALEPKDDGDLTIDWNFNGKPLRQSSRFKHIHDFGMVVFEIMGIRNLDEGKYTCVATNKAGMDETSFNIKFSEKSIQDHPKFVNELKVCNRPKNYNRLRLIFRIQ